MFDPAARSAALVLRDGFACHAGDDFERGLAGEAVGHPVNRNHCSRGEIMNKLSQAAALMGRKGGLVRSLSHRQAVKNGSLGGRPREYPPCPKQYGKNKAHRFSKKGRCPCGYQR